MWRVLIDRRTAAVIETGAVARQIENLEVLGSWHHRTHDDQIAIRVSSVVQTPIHQCTRAHPAKACDVRIREAAEKCSPSSKLPLLEVVVDLQNRPCDPSHLAVVDDLHAPGALLEIVLHEAQVSAGRAFVHRLTVLVNRSIAAETHFVPRLAPFAAMSPSTDHAESGHQRAIGQRERDRFKGVVFHCRQHRHITAPGRRHRTLRHIKHGHGVVAARRLEFHLPQGIAILRSTRDTLHPVIARVAAQIEELFGAALAIGDFAQRHPGHAVIRSLDLVGLAVGVLPCQLDVAHLDFLPKVELKPGFVVPVALPVGAHAAIERQSWCVPAVLSRIGGRYRGDLFARVAHVHGLPHR